MTKKNFVAGSVLRAADVNTYLTSSRNLAINGGMDIWQRGTTLSGNNKIVDLFSLFSYSTSFTQAQDTDIPTGVDVQYSWKITNNSAKTTGAADYTFIDYRIEANNTSFLRFGYSDARSVIVSFYVKSSVTGTYSGVFASSDNSRSYGFNFTISAANVWQRVTITLTGDLSGFGTKWLGGTNIGFWIKIDLGSGSNYKIASAGSWLDGANRCGITGSATWSTTNGATFYMTGLQVEEGSVETPFSRATSTIQSELAACQRYYFRYTGNGGTYKRIPGSAIAISSSLIQLELINPVPMRIIPTSIDVSGLIAYDGISIFAVGAVTPDQYGVNASSIGLAVTGATGYRPYWVATDSTGTGYIGLSAEM